MTTNNPAPENFKLARDGAALDAITVVEIVQDVSPDVVWPERIYRETVNRVGDFLRERYLEIATDILREAQD